MTMIWRRLEIPSWLVSAAVALALVGCGSSSDTTTSTAYDPPVMTEAPAVVGACCSVASCTETTYDACTQGAGAGLWANQAICSAANCTALLGQVSTGDGLPGEDEDEEDDEALVTCCEDSDLICSQLNAVDCAEFGGTVHLNATCAQACPSYEEVFEIELATCCLPVDNMCTYIDEIECEERGGSPAFDAECVEICPELPEVEE